MTLLIAANEPRRRVMVGCLRATLQFVADVVLRPVPFEGCFAARYSQRDSSSQETLRAIPTVVCTQRQDFALLFWRNKNAATSSFQRKDLHDSGRTHGLLVCVFLLFGAL